MTRKKRRDPDAIKTLISAPTRHARRVTSQQCTATSKRTQERCRAWAMVGRKTCRVHGSATKRSAVAATKRIADASGFAADMLVEFMADPKVDIKLRTQIAQDLLTRANVNGKTMVEIGAADAYAHVVEMSTVPIDAPLDPDDWDDPRNDSNIIDAVVVEDDPDEDERIIRKDRAMQKRARQGKQPALPPSQAKQFDMTEDPRERPAFESPAVERRRKHEAFLRDRLIDPDDRPPNRTQRSRG